jgi:hypothetical protein
MKRLLPAAALLAAASLPRAAQAPVHAVSGPIRHVVLHADGTLTAGAPWSPAGETAGTTFANVTQAGLYATPPVGQEWVDWGVKSGGSTGVACTLELGYATTALDPSLGGPGAALQIAVYAGTVGGCNPTDVATQVRRLVYSGLPGSLDGGPAAFTVAIELAKQTFALADGPLGWGYVGVDGLSGPLLIAVGADPTGTVDGYDPYAPAPAPTGACLGTSVFAMPGVGSFYLRLEEEDGSEPGAQAPRVGTGFNPGVLSPAATPPKIGQSWQPSLTTPAVGTPSVDFFAISSVALAPTLIPGLGELLIGVASPNPLFVLAGPAGTGTPFSMPFPLNCALVGVSLTSQAGQVGVLGKVGLTNALDFTIGF